MDDLKEKLKAELDTCSWNLLDKNLERGAVFLVDENIGLIDVAYSIAKDQTQVISNLLTNKQLRKLNIDDSDYKDSQFQYLIIQPYVLVQLINK